ncbi:MAG: sulfotransferase family protein [Gemmataceae bacterium]
MICITGSHRSGSSMVAWLLNLAGVYLGADYELLQPAPDNPEGFWENLLFVNLNNGLLHRLKGSWHEPPRFEPGWFQRSEFQPLHDQARTLIERFDAQRPWGWKDPRTSLTLPFWKHLVPGLKVVVCLRNPGDVARSLEARGEKLPFVELWHTYNRRLLEATRPEERLVTHYESYFHHPEAELRRVLSWLGLATSGPGFEQALASIRRPLKHHETTISATLEQIPPQILDAYMEMCAEAGPVFADWLRQRPIEIDGLQLTVGPQRDAPLGYREVRLLARLSAERATLKQECSELTSKLDVTHEKLALAHQELAEARKELDGVARSRAWQLLQILLKPLRVFRRKPT